MRAYTEDVNLVTGEALNIGAPKTLSDPLEVGEGWYDMRLRVNLVFLVGTGSGAIAEGELLIIQNIELKTNRGETICDVPARFLYKLAHARNSVAPIKNAIAAADATYRVNIPISFVDFKMLRPEDTILDTKRYSSLTLIVKMGTVANLLTTVGTSSVTSTIDVEVTRSLDKLSESLEPLGMHIYYSNMAPVDANSVTEIKLDRSADLSYKRVLIHHGSGGTAGEPFSGANADDAIDVVSMEDNNGKIVRDRPWEMIKNGNVDHYGLAAVLAGINILDFVRDGSIKSALATGDKSRLAVKWTNQTSVAANDIVTVGYEGIRTLK